MPPPLLRVALAVIRRPDGRAFVQRRNGDGPLAGVWEFPGGKLEPGESPHAAAVREVREEMGAEVRAGRILAVHCHDYGAIEVELTAVECEFLPGGEPAPAPGGEATAWMSFQELRSGPIPPANDALMELIEGSGGEM